MHHPPVVGGGLDLEVVGGELLLATSTRDSRLATAGMLKSDLNFEVWRQLAAAGLTIAPSQGGITLGLQLVPSSTGRP